MAYASTPLCSGAFRGGSTTVATVPPQRAAVAGPMRAVSADTADGPVGVTALRKAETWTVIELAPYNRLRLAAFEHIKRISVSGVVTFGRLHANLSATASIH
jgi:hypothetical protein